ncbi:MAG: heparan-alpha-glucosaminide N-acetyltransferase domain-containing protein [Planctomycetota bacterium]
MAYAEQTTESASAQAGRGRLLSLDAFRGFDIAAMLLVNMTWNREVFHPQFFHVEWNDKAQGATFTDLVFPWFVFIAGCSIPLSMRSGRGRAQPAWLKVLIALKRAAIIYLLGVLLTVAGSATDRPLVWNDLLSWNILQLIAGAYFCAVLIFLLPRWGQIAAVVGILLAKWATMTVIPFEVVEQAGLVRAPAGHPTGAGTWAHHDGIKRLLHMEHESGVGFALLGWLGMTQQYLPLAACAVIGGWATQIMTGAGSTAGRTLRVAGLALGLLVVAFALQWNYDPAGGGLLGRFTAPFSKWTISPAYVLLSAGTGMLLLVAFWLVIDVWKLTTALVLRVWGLNAIALYVGAELFFKVIYSKWQVTHPNGFSGSLAGGVIAWVEHWTGSAAVAGWCFALSWIGLGWLLCWWMHAKKLYIKV